VIFSKKKIRRIDLKVCFPEYTGGNDSKAGTDFLTQKFISLNRVETKTVYCHVTCATDTENIAYVFAAVKDIILRLSLTKSGI